MEREIISKLGAILEVLVAIKSKQVKPRDVSLKNEVLNNASLGDLLQISQSTIRRWVRSGKLKYTLVQRTRFYLLEDVLALLGKNPD